MRAFGVGWVGHLHTSADDALQQRQYQRCPAPSTSTSCAYRHGGRRRACFLHPARRRFVQAVAALTQSPACRRRTHRIGTWTALPAATVYPGLASSAGGRRRAACRPGGAAAAAAAAAARCGLRAQLVERLRPRRARQPHARGHASRAIAHACPRLGATLRASPLPTSSAAPPTPSAPGRRVGVRA